MFVQERKDRDGAMIQELTLKLKGETNVDIIIKEFFLFLEIAGYEIDAEELCKDLGIKNRFTDDWNSFSSM